MEIVINGIDINALAAQQRSLRQGAVRFISDNIGKAQDLVRQVIAEEDETVRDNLAREATELLEAISLVATVTSTQYYLPYNEPYDGGNALSDQLEDEHNVYDSPDLRALYDTLYSMEQESYLWNSSSVHC